MTSPPHEPQALAEAASKAMWDRDEASKGLGITLEEVRPGYARMKMRIRPDMLNGHLICHGGFIFTLSDSTFAFACNSRNLNTVASGCSIDYLAPARGGDILTAEGTERSLSGRTGVYDIAVTNQQGITVALFRGRSYRIKGEVIAGLEAISH